MEMAILARHNVTLLGIESSIRVPFVVTQIPNPKIDRRKHNNPHVAIAALGAQAAKSGMPIHACPYMHPAMRASWIKGFAQEQQQSFEF
jgi:ribosome modulation factor